MAGHGVPFNATSIQPLLAISLGEGVTVGPSGTISYNWNADSSDAWTVPVGLNIGKATQINGKPIKFSFSLEYNVVRPDSFGPEWKMTFAITLVVKNPFLQ